MPKTVIEEKCANCGRTLYGTDFLRGLAELEFYNTWGDAPAERFVHTYDCENEPRRLLAPPAPEAKCPACEGNGFTLETVNECCGHGTPSGDCCGDPVPGQEQVGCERCQTTGKVATPPAPEATDGN